MLPAPLSPSRIVFLANGLYGRHVAGGDIHLFHMAKEAEAAGWPTLYIGGHALGDHLAQQGLRGEWLPTDDEVLPPLDATTIAGQFRLFRSYLSKTRRTQRLLQGINQDDVVYASTHFWFDVVPAVRCPARRKGVIIHMLAPSFKELILRTRPDVASGRMASLHAALSQSFGLRMLRSSPEKRIFYVHPDMAPTLRKMGFGPQELFCLPNGIDADAIRSLAAPPLTFDVVWLGRLHRQKGLDHLAATLNELASRIDGFRALMVGDIQEHLIPMLSPAARQATSFPGFVTGPKRFHLLKSARVFLMPSTHESWGIVMAEALACGLPVIAFELAAYRQIFGDGITYAPCFEAMRFARLAENLVRRRRHGEEVLNQHEADDFMSRYDWKRVGASFLEAMSSWPSRAG